jgi:hypothetical protein
MNGACRHTGENGATAFQAAFAAARAARSALLADERTRKKRQKARKRREMPEGLTADEQRTWRLKEQLRIDDAKHFVENARFESSLVQERLREGFRLLHARKVGRRWREPFRERGLRSDDLGIPGKMFVAACRKGGDLRSSWDKATLGVESRSKLLSLDLPWVELNKQFLSVIRIDLDMVWSDVYAFRDDVRQLVGSKLPHAPHLVVGDELPDGRFEHPHLYFFLPPGSQVWNAPEDPRCNRRLIDFFKGVSYGIVDALRSLRADPNAPVLTMRGKNPLSPLWTSFCMEEQDFCSLTEWAEWVNTGIDRDTLVRSMAAEQADLDVPTSNLFFNTVQKAAYRILASWHFERDNRARLSENALADALHAALEPVAQNTAEGMADRCGRRMSERQVALMVARVSAYAAGAFDPGKLQRKTARGTLMHAVDGLRTVRERQQVAAEYASTEKAQRTLDRLLEAWDAISVETTEISKSALAREAKVSRTTVHARWADLQAVIASRTTCPVRCIDKKPPVGTAMAEPQGTTVQDWAPSNTVVETVESYTGGDRRPVDSAPAIRDRTDSRDSVTRIRLPVPPAAGPADVMMAADAAPWPESWTDGEDSDEDDDLRLLDEQESFLSAAMHDGSGRDDPEPWEWSSGTMPDRPTLH